MNFQIAFQTTKLRHAKKTVPEDYMETTFQDTASQPVQIILTGTKQLKFVFKLVTSKSLNYFFTLIVQPILANHYTEVQPAHLAHRMSI